MPFPKHAVLAAVVLLVAASPFAQDGRVTLEQIMADPDWLGRQPQNPYWADDNLSFLLRAKSRTGPRRAICFPGRPGRPP